MERLKEIRTCKVHGEVEFVYYETTKRWRCLKCQAEATQKRRDKIKLLAIEFKGGKCCKCGYNKCKDALEFHHLDSKQKDFGIAGKGYTRSWDKTKQELEKCILVCSNCHREIHTGLIEA